MKHNLQGKIFSREFDWGKMNIISLGERGRGRYEAIIPVHNGNIEIENLDYMEVALTKSGKPKIVPSEKSEGWLLILSGNGTYTRGTYGTVYVQEERKNDVAIIARGSGAYGTAGRIGSYHEFLASCPDNTFFYICPAGGSHKRERYWVYCDSEKIYQISLNEIDMFCEQKNISVPAIELTIDLATREVNIR